MLELYESFTACHVEREGSCKDLLDSFRLRFDIFCREKRFLAAEDYPDHSEYDYFDELSEHIVVRECESEKLVGTVRLVRHSHELGFPTAHHFSGLYTTLADVPLDKTYEVSRLCILPLYRQRLVPKDRRNGIVLISIIKKMYQIVASLGGIT